MAALQFDPAQEKATLYTAIAVLEKQWGKPDMAYAVSALRAAVVRAEQALSVLEPEPNKEPVFVIQVLGLGFLVMYAQGELARAEQCALDPLGRGSQRKVVMGTRERVLFLTLAMAISRAAQRSRIFAELVAP